MQKNWLITGVSSGLGRAFAEAIVARGDTVVGTVRRENDKAAFVSLGSSARAVLIDVTDESQMRKAFAESLALLDGRIDVLVNNAGYGVFGSIEQLSMEQVRSQMEVNFFGALQLTQLALPTFRSQRGGTIVQISSMAGQTGSPGLGIYNASKWALEGFSEALSHEVAHLGIRVVIVEPGAFRTDWAGRSMDVVPPLPDYLPSVGVVQDRLEKVNGNQPGDPSRAAALLLELVDSDAPPLRIAFGEDSVDRIRAKLIAQLKDLDTWSEKSQGLGFV